MSAALRVLVVDDDPVYRHVLVKTLGRIPGIELVGTAATLAIAQHKIECGHVDVVTLDVVLNQESGLDLLSWIQPRYPKMVTVLLTAGTARKARGEVDALLLGASALILKPTGAGAALALETALTVALRRPWVPVKHSPQMTVARPLVTAMPREVIAVGASTGGPPVVLEFLKALPRHFDVPVLLTQHMPTLHLPYFAELLGRESGRPVHLVSDGTVVERGMVYVASGGKHVRVGRIAGRLAVFEDDGPEEHHVRPAVDPMFRSVAAVCGAASVGVVMTGMGSDGALGAVALRKKGAPVVIQDKATSVVWGMPGAVDAAGAANEVVPAAALAGVVTAWTNGWKSGGGVST